MHSLSSAIETAVKNYRVHILVFLITLLVAITIAHPSIFVTDEWITINQLAQIQDGHQVIISEGKYGSMGNGSSSDFSTPSKYYLVYPLFLPVISVPALWIVNGLDRFFGFFVIYFWTFLLIVLALFVNAYFPGYCRIGKYRWTSGIIIAAFVLFFANLYFNSPFAVTGNEAFPEVLAVVLTNIALLTLIAVIIYEINLSIFRESAYSVFGTLVCLSCSSYFFWANYCKDHILVAFLFVLLTLMVVRFILNENSWYLAGAFFMSGILAWARPELALFVFLSLCLFVLYIFLARRGPSASSVQPLPLFITPLFTFIGAVPFLINNYLFTKNIFIPAWILWKIPVPSADTVVPGSVPVQITTTDTLGSLLHLFFSSVNFQPATVLPDVYGVLFNPQNGNLGVFPIVPLFLIALFLMPVLWLYGRWQISLREKYFLAAMSLLAFGVFSAYFRGISGMNVSVGIVPDMRYLSPIYLPLNIIALLVIRKLPFVSEKPISIVKGIICSWIVIIPLTIFAMMVFYPAPESFEDLFPPLHIITVLVLYILITLCLIGILGTVSFDFPKIFGISLLALTCAIPFIWQVDASFLIRLFGTGLGGYSFIIPVVRVVLLLHFI